MTRIDISQTGFIIPPAYQGQMLEVSFGPVEGGVVRRTHDRADGTTVYDYADYADLAGVFDPQNEPPTAEHWRRVEVSE